MEIIFFQSNSFMFIFFNAYKLHRKKERSSFARIKICIVNLLIATFKHEHKTKPGCTLARGIVSVLSM
jgi:hypothetical protein